jgi:hypothetical protein
MKIFGIEFQTRKELKENISRLENELRDLHHRCRGLKIELDAMKDTFPFVFGQTVYDVQLRNEKGRYARKNPSLKHSRINEVVVDEKNYFGLVERYNRQDVFIDYDTVDAFLMDVCAWNV